MAEHRWVLAYNQSCDACHQLADYVAELAGGKLEVRSLREPQVVAWREAAGLSEVWAPTLFRERANDVRAWVGRGLTWRLGVLLGPANAIRVARLLARQDALESSEPAVGSSRRGFLTKLGLAATGGIALAAGKVPLAAHAASLAGSGASSSPGAFLHQESLAEDAPLRQAALASPDMQLLVHRYGLAALSGPTVHAQYADPAVEAVCFTLTRPGQPHRFVYAYFRPNRSDFHVLQFEFIPDPGTGWQGNHQGLISGQASFYSAGDAALGHASFRNGQMVASSRPAVAPLDEDWNCFGWCINSIWPRLPWWIQRGCEIACGGCLVGVEPACAACLGCLGGYGSACFAWCWY